MTGFDTTSLSNNITLINRYNPNTPRVAISIYADGGNRTEKIPGVSDLATRLLIKGTKNRTSEQIASEIDNNALELGVEVKQDFTRARAVCLNEDIDKAIDLITDIIQFPTFELFEKEVKLYSGELQVELDSPKSKASDTLIRTMYPDHPYGVVSSKILENINSISLSNIQENFCYTYNARNLNIAVVGDFATDTLKQKLEDKLGNIAAVKAKEKLVLLPAITENKIVTESKEDVSQAQIIMGWYGPPVDSSDFAPLSILNNILGAAGLSSRLFLELRDKKGLAYNVRSSFEVFRYSSNITIYIGTEPKNIDIAIKGIYEEVRKMIDNPVSSEELESAKKNVLGKRAIFHETNAQQCYYMGLYHILGVGAKFDEQVPEMIRNTTVDQVQAVAQKYLSKYNVTSILAPSKFLSLAEKE